jgi:hypothetical protein
MYLRSTVFEFDRVFSETEDNDCVYASTAAPLVRKAAEGGVVTLFMFGQTGSGKTFTMAAIHERAAAVRSFHQHGSHSRLYSGAPCAHNQHAIPIFGCVLRLREGSCAGALCGTRGRARDRLSLLGRARRRPLPRHAQRGCDRQDQGSSFPSKII